mmetsp:Transcript_26083/g.60863  ORF Transcript_26083/g.60863 Transcript_26083/m.60863 type:complete len:615 (-) Transcript_26083:205-2049(-)
MKLLRLPFKKSSKAPVATPAAPAPASEPVQAPKPTHAAEGTSSAESGRRVADSRSPSQPRNPLGAQVAGAHKGCRNNCGWTAFGQFATCCPKCRGPDGPHSEDCPTKNQPAPRLCERGCGRLANGSYRTCSRDCRGPEETLGGTCAVCPPQRQSSAPSSPSVPIERGSGRKVSSQPLCACSCGRPAFASFSTCCSKCVGPDGPHASDCARKAGLTADSTAAAVASAQSLPKTAEEVLEALRSNLAEWHAARITKKRAEVEDIIEKYATSASMSMEAVRMIWLQAARQARPVGAPVARYVSLAKRHHGIDVEVVDLGGGSAKHQNSCMFLTCAVSLAEQRSRGFDFPDGPVGDSLRAACPDTNAFEPAEELIAQHRRTRQGTLGRMADALREAACQALALDSEFFRPFFSPLRGGGSDKKAYDSWVQKMHGDEEGDELVILALARILGIAVQPVQQSGYRVPLMDPMGVAEKSGVSYWGNDDRHWVWLSPCGDESTVRSSPSLEKADSCGKAAVALADDAVSAVASGQSGRVTAPPPAAAKDSPLPAAPHAHVAKAPPAQDSSRREGSEACSALSSPSPPHPKKAASAAASPAAEPQPRTVASKGAAPQYPVGLF